MGEEPSGGMVPSGAQLPDRLPPVAQGWRIRRSQGHKSWQLAPPRAQPVVRVLSWTPYVATIGLVIALQARGHGGLWFFWLIGKGGLAKVGSVAAAGVALGRLSTRLTAWYLRTIAGLRLTADSLRAKREGDLVRLRGTVRADHSFPSAVSGEPSVFVHYEVRARERKYSDLAFDEVRGIDFLVDIQGSEPVLIAAADAFITDGHRCTTDAPADVTIMIALSPGGTLCREARIAPGDQVEVIGTLSRELDPDAQRTHSRDLPSQVVLRGTRRLPVLVRRLTA